MPDETPDAHGRAGADHAPARGPLRELAAVFLRLGVTAFGGPAAHIAMMEDEVVSRRRWMSRGAFLDLLGATNLIPGPNSTELAIFIGHARAGAAGLVVAGICFILPAVAIVTILAWVYVHYGTLPRFGGILYAIKPIVIAIVCQALWRLGRSALRSPRSIAAAAVALALTLLGLDELAVLAVAAATGLLLVRHGRSARDVRPSGTGDRVSIVGPMALTPLVQTAAGSAAAAGLWPIFAFFAKVGAVLFGSGYVLLAFLRTGLVVERGWLTEQQLLDAVAIGQVTPGPVFTTATFVGYVLAGGPGASAATIGIFLPAFVFVALSGWLLPHVRRSPRAGAMLDGVTAASLALMGVVTVQLARVALVDAATIVIGLASIGLLFKYRTNPAWLILGGLAVGLIFVPQ